MSKSHFDIDDDEIRIISSADNKAKTGKLRRRRVVAITAACLIASAIIGALVFLFVRPGVGTENNTMIITEEKTDRTTAIDNATTDSTPAKGYTSFRDTIVGGVGLSILTPHNATATLEVGGEAYNDSAAVLTVQAADIRSDNGSIAGAFVARGELLSRGQAKSGYCAIIDGDFSIGVADSTPLLEQALASDGYFFRQYPLVVSGQPIENKPKGKALRKALAEIDGHISVILSKERLTFKEFSQALADAGVNNAIYLVGSSAAGYYSDSEGDRFCFGIKNERMPENVNFIVWR